MVVIRKYYEVWVFSSMPWSQSVYSQFYVKFSFAISGRWRVIYVDICASGAATGGVGAGDGIEGGLGRRNGLGTGQRDLADALVDGTGIVAAAVPG